MPRLVVLRALGLGDLLTAVPALRALAAAFPHHERVLAVPAALRGLVDLLGVVDDTVDVDLRAGPGALPPARVDAAAAAALAAADVAVNLHGRGPESTRLLLRGRPRRLIAFAHPDVPETSGAARWHAGEHEVARWCRLLQSVGIAADATALDVVVPRSLQPEGLRDATLLHPGAASAARRWPVERWAAVARREAGAGRRVVVTAGPGETALATMVAGAAGLPPEAVRRPPDVAALAGLVAGVGRVVCGDTGVAHLATAVGTPSVVLFGPVSPRRWGPPPGRPRHRALWRGDGTGDPHGDVPDDALLRIEVDDVVAALAGTGVTARRA